MKPKLICLFIGCKWETTLQFWSLGEYLTIQQCERCGAHRTITK